MIQEWITGQQSKLSLVNKDMFLGYGGDNEFIVKSYVDASFDTDLDDSESRSGYILKVGPMTLFCDNTGAIALAKEPRFHRKTRHIKRRFNSIRESVQNGDIDIFKVHTDLNVADPLTKPLPRAKHDQHQNSMGVRFITM